MIKNYTEWLNEAAEIDSKELAVGKEVEMEHTSDEEEAEKIAKDHLAEDPQYYKKLGKAGLIDEPEALQKAKGLDEGKFESDEIFFLWDETVDDDREGIEAGHTTHRGKAATVFSFDAKNRSAFMNFKKKAAEYLKKNGLKHEDTGEQLFVFEG